MQQDDDLNWYHLSLCRDMETNWFYDDYERDPVLAAVMDDICLACPVRKFCLMEGLDNKEYGLWGGIFLDNGNVDKVRNEHKTEDVWSQIRSGIK